MGGQVVFFEYSGHGGGRARLRFSVFMFFRVRWIVKGSPGKVSAVKVKWRWFMCLARWTVARSLAVTAMATAAKGGQKV